MKLVAYLCLFQTVELITVIRNPRQVDSRNVIISSNNISATDEATVNSNGLSFTEVTIQGNRGSTNSNFTSFSLISSPESQVVSPSIKKTAPSPVPQSTPPKKI